MVVLTCAAFPSASSVPFGKDFSDPLCKGGPNVTVGRKAMQLASVHKGTIRLSFRLMDSSQPTTDQAKLMAERVQPMLGYLNALRARCEKRLPVDDKLRLDAERAYDALHRLSVTLHYMSCQGGVGRAGR